MALTNWYIDAWAVRDGAAFASRRESNSRNAENTVFIAVPDLEPVPVGRLSTALSATRRNFQAGLQSDNGIEIAFSNLEQIVELVRRGFLSAGLGPDGSGAPFLGRTPQAPSGNEEMIAPVINEGPPSGGSGHYEDVVDHTETQEWLWHNAQWPVEKSLAFLTEASTKTIDDSEAFILISHLLTLIDTYAEAITIDWEWRVQQYADPLDTKMLIDWYRALCEAGVWSNDVAMRGFVERHRCLMGEQLLLNWRYGLWATSQVHDFVELPRQHLLSYAPCPRRPGWVSGLSRFADKVTLPMCIGNYFEINRFLPELAPSLLGAILLTFGGFPSSLVTGNRFKRARLAAALRWISKEIPHVTLPPEAEGLINNYAWQRLEGRLVGA